MHLDSAPILERARKVFAIEAAALQQTADALDGRFVAVVAALAESIRSGRKLLVTGVGKNVHIAQKIAGTFNSTGVPTSFLDAVQALHGDLGLCGEGDLCLLLSNSGETEEMLRVLPFLKRLGVRTVAITAVAASTLGRGCDHCLTYVYGEEACPLKLAPTASTTAALALGDALAMTYLEVRRFAREDFARFHPAGSLGKVLLLSVRDIMRSGERFAVRPQSVTVQEAILAITEAKCGSIALTDPSTGQLTGVFSDGDFRRAALREPLVLQQPVARFMTANPKTVSAEAMAVEALKIFEKHKINSLIAIEADGTPAGMVDGQDMPKLRLV